MSGRYKLRSIGLDKQIESYDIAGDLPSKAGTRRPFLFHPSKHPLPKPASILKN